MCQFSWPLSLCLPSAALTSPRSTLPPLLGAFAGIFAPGLPGGFAALAAGVAPMVAFAAAVVGGMDCSAGATGGYADLSKTI